MSSLVADHAATGTTDARHRLKRTSLNIEPRGSAGFSAARPIPQSGPAPVPVPVHRFGTTGWFGWLRLYALVWVAGVAIFGALIIVALVAHAIARLAG